MTLRVFGIHTFSPYLLQVTLTEERLRRAEEPMDEDESYLERLSGGLYVLQLVDYIIVDCSSNAPSSVKCTFQR